MKDESEGFPEWYEGGRDSGGSTLVLVHGFSVSWRIWRPILALLERHHHIIAPTLPGHVGGLPLTQRATPQSIADALANQLRERGISQAHFVGQSLGGWMVIEMARRGLARSALGVCSGGAWRSQADIEKFVRDGRALLRLLPVLVPLFKLAVGNTALRKLVLSSEMQHGDRMSAADARMRFDRLLRMKIAREFLDESMQPVQPLPPDRQVPLKMIWGDRDTTLPFEKFGQPLLDTLGLTSCVMLEDCGHNPMFDAPQRVADEILDFVREVENSAAR